MKERARVCHVCNGHATNDVRVFQRTCVGLAEQGYDTHLIATAGGFATQSNVGAADMRPYVDRGVHIHPLPPVVGRLDRLRRRSSVARMARDLEPELFHVHEPDLLPKVLQVAGTCPVVYDVHESFPDVIRERRYFGAPLLGSLFAVMFDRRERHWIKRCRAVIAVTDRVAQRYRPLHERVVVVSNYPELMDDGVLAGYSRDGTVCVYTGIVSPQRGITRIFEAFGILKSRGIEARFEFAGPVFSDSYLASLWKLADRLGVRDRITYHGFISSRKDLVDLQCRADIGLVLNQPVRNAQLSIPNKLGEFMCQGLPVVFSRFPNYLEIAGESGAGIAVDPTCPEEIAEAIAQLLLNPGMAGQMAKRGRDATRERFNWDVERRKLFALYGEILG